MSTSPNLPNIVGHYWFRAAEIITGVNGASALIYTADLTQYIEDKPPSDLQHDFPVDHFAILNLAYIQMGGRRGGGGMMKRAGMAWITEMVRDQVVDIPRDLPVPTFDLINVVLNPLTRFTDESILTLDETDSVMTVQFEICPNCWGLNPETVPLRAGKTDPSPICHFIVGVLSEGVRIALQRELEVVETACHAQGDDHCIFSITK